jgi:hypothetical protein
VNSVPNMKKKTPAVQVFLRDTAGVEGLRNLIQHLDQEMKQLIDGNHPAWGALAWVKLVDANELVFECSQFVPGTTFDGDKAPIVNPLGRVLKGEIDHVELHAGNLRVSLSHVMETVRLFATRFEKSLAGAFTEKPKSVRDILVAVTIKANKAK